MMKGCGLTLLLLVTLVFPIESQVRFQLAPPLIRSTSVFFTDSARVTMYFAQSGTRIHYSFKHTLPTSDDPLYKGPLTIKEAVTTVHARSYAEAEFLPSDPVSITLIKEGLPLTSLTTSAPNPKYPGSGPATLTDNLGGLASVGSPTWMGFDTDTASFTVTLKQEAIPERVLLHFLQNEDSWIFLPERITVYAITGEGEKEIARLSNSTDQPHAGSRCVPQFLQLQPTGPVAQLRISINGVSHLPGWHAGKGQHAWVFIDEIKIY